MAQKIISEIREEEKAQVDEGMTLLRALDPKGLEWFISGEIEVKEMLKGLGISKPKMLFIANQE